MNTSTFLAQINSPVSLKKAVIYALESFTSAAAQCDAIYSAYLDTLAKPEDFKPVEFVQAIAPIACGWFQAHRVAVAEYLGSGAQWTDSADYAAIQSGFTSLRQKISRQTGGVTFQVKGRLTVDAILSGEVTAWELDTKKYDASKPAGEVTASGKSSSPAAAGADVPTAEGGATALESIVGDKHMAKAALLEILKAYPELANQKSVIQAFHTASNSAAKKSAAKKAADKKAA